MLTGLFAQSSYIRRGFEKMTIFRSIVLYKDSTNARIQCYGPFVCPDTATEFMDRLPVPLKGGRKVLRTLVSYTGDKSALASETILRERRT
jgi:hypothetical protein